MVEDFLKKEKYYVSIPNELFLVENQISTDLKNDFFYPKDLSSKKFYDTDLGLGLRGGGSSSFGKVSNNKNNPTNRALPPPPVVRRKKKLNKEGLQILKDQDSYIADRIKNPRFSYTKGKVRKKGKEQDVIKTINYSNSYQLTGPFLMDVCRVPDHYDWYQISIAGDISYSAFTKDDRKALRKRITVVLDGYKAKGVDMRIDVIDAEYDHATSKNLRHVLPLNDKVFPVMAKPKAIHVAQTALRK